MTTHTETGGLLVVVGAGMAGGELALSARHQGWTGRIMLLGAEPLLPYHRPPLSKAFLAGTATAESLQIRPVASYEEARIELRLGVRVLGLDRAARLLTLDDGSTLQYDKAALCLGGQARALRLPGLPVAGAVNLQVLRTQADALAISQTLNAADANTPGTEFRVALVGAGYIGLEVAASARARGAAVTVLEAQSRVLARVAGQAISDFYTEVHRQAGVQVCTGVRDTKVVMGEGELAERIVALRVDGQELPVDLVVAGIGLEPDVALAQGAGLDVDEGIVVDHFACTSDPNIYAAGDCTRLPSALYGRSLRLESVPNALEQARAAAAAICGKPRVYDPVPWFWSDQYDLKLQTVGLSPGHDQVVLRGDPASRAFSALYLAGGRLIAADCINRPADFMVAKRLVGARAEVSAALLADEALPLKSLLAATPQ